MKKPEEGDFDYEIRKDTYKECPEIDRLAALCKGNMGLIFCKDNVSEVKDIIYDIKREKGAKIGAVAPSDVKVLPGPTGLDPKQTAFFQALNITTKIVKTQIEIQDEHLIIQAGKKIGSSECTLCDKLGIKPFVYRMKILNIYDQGSVFSADVLDFKEEDILKKFTNGCSYLTALSLQAAFPTQLSVSHSILKGFKNLTSMTLQSDFSFKQGEKLKQIALNPEKYAQVAVGNK
jgi:large subunit ribosomal protein LP0